MSRIVCRPRSLSVPRLRHATTRAAEINPANTVERREVLRTQIGRRGGPRRLAVVIGRRWPVTGVRLTVSFMDSPPRDLRKRILLHMSAWGKTANVVFSETRGTGQVRIARLDSPPDDAGYWSWIGTEILEIDEDKPTMNLEGFTMRVSENEFRRVVRHQAGHTLGFEHEHLRNDLVKKIDRAKAIAYYDLDQGWTPEEVEEQVLTPLSKQSIMGTAESDPTSIMCYQIPAAITKTGKAIVGGKDINEKDFAFAASIYPKSVQLAEAPPTTHPPRFSDTRALGKKQKKNGSSQAKGAGRNGRSRTSSKTLMRKRAARPTAAAPSASPATSVNRLPAIDFHELVRAGETNALTIRLSDIISTVDRDKSLSVPIPKGKAHVKISVSISAPGFKVAPKRELPIVVGRTFDAKREQVVFKLTAMEPPTSELVKREISADIWLKGVCIGGVKHWTNVVSAKYRGPLSGDGRSRATPFALDDPGRSCDLVIRVVSRDEAGAPPFDVSIRTPTVESDPMGRISFTRAAFAATLHQHFAKFATALPDDASKAAINAWRQDLLTEIDVLGRWLWSHLPAKFQDKYFQLHDSRQAPKSIMVHSDEMVIPWELVVPHRNGKSLPRLGVAHVMGRWRPSLGIRPRPQRMAVESPTIVNPKYFGTEQLLWSEVESADLRAAFPYFRALHGVDRTTFDKLLRRKDVRLLHFTGHGKFAAPNADLSTLVLEKGDSVTPMHFIGTPLLAKAQPIMYLNACEAGNTGVVMGRMGGFVAQFVENGCSGVIAPYWAINDGSARDFAIAFYAELVAGRSIGEGLRNLRKKNLKNPTFQAFAYLGDPWTRTQFS